MNIIFSFVAVCLAAITAGDSVVEDVELLGKWQSKQLEAEVLFHVQPTRIQIDNNADDEHVEIELTRNDPSASPKEMDGVKRRGTLRGKVTDDVGLTMRMIYEIDGRKLRVALLRPGSQGRPSEFSGAGVKVYEFQRVATEPVVSKASAMHSSRCCRIRCRPRCRCRRN